MSVQSVLEAQQKAKDRVELAFITPLFSKNERDKWHWSKRLRHRKMWTTNIGWKQQKPDKPPEVKQIVTVTRHLDKGQRLWGNANGYGGTMVELVDSLVHCGYFKDDSPKWCETRFVQDDKNRDKPTRTTITLEIVN